MKHILITFTALLVTTSVFAQSSEKILGTWYNHEKDGKIEVYKKDNKYFGKIIWIKNNTNDDGSSPRLDKKNPSEKLKMRPIVGTNILTELEWDAEENEWNDGEIYDPKSGSTYSVFARLEDPNTLYIKGYIGFSLIGRSTTWTRVK